MSKVDALINNYEKILKEPWVNKLSGHEKVWFLVYDPIDERKVALRIGDFERITKEKNKNWVEIDLKFCFPEWMKQHEYREEYFADPEAIKDQIESNFKNYVIQYIAEIIQKTDNLENTIIAITNVSSLFGFIKLSDVLSELYEFNKGRILIFFPGEFQNNHFRLMDARDGWSYLARPITA